MLREKAFLYVSSVMPALWEAGERQGKAQVRAIKVAVMATGDVGLMEIRHNLVEVVKQNHCHENDDDDQKDERNL